jgi:hypothetical protein
MRRLPPATLTRLNPPHVGLAAAEDPLAIRRFEARIPDLLLWIRCSRVSATAIVPPSHVALAEIRV